MHNTSMFARRSLDRIHFIHTQRERLFAQHMLARFDGFDRPFGVQVIRQ